MKLRTLCSGREEVTEMLILRITGMTCDHCARSIEEVLNALPGVRGERIL
jgi:copper chaperone CopZ